MSTLRPFEAAVRLGSFKAAADELHLTQSAISHQISSLESHFQTKLFMRQGNRLALTKAGTVYGATVIKLLAELSEAGARFYEDKQVLRVSASPSFAMYAALPYIEKLKSQNSWIDLQLESRNGGADLHRESIDAAIQVRGTPVAGLKTHRLFQSRLRPLAHRTLIERFGPIRTASDLARMPLIDVHHASGLWETWFAKVDRNVKLGEIRLWSDSLLGAVQMAEAGVGVLLAPFPLLVSLVSSGRLEITIAEPVIVERPDLYLMYRNRDANSAKVRAIKHWLDFIVTDMQAKATSIGL